MKSIFAVALLALGACGTQPASQPVAQRTETIQRPSTQETERFIRKAAEEWAAVGVTAIPLIFSASFLTITWESPHQVKCATRRRRWRGTPLTRAFLKARSIT